MRINSGQIIIFHQPRFPWNKGNSLTKPPFGVRSCEVAIIWPDKLVSCSDLLSGSSCTSDQPTASPQPVLVQGQIHSDTVTTCRMVDKWQQHQKQGQYLFQWYQVRTILETTLALTLKKHLQLTLATWTKISGWELTLSRRCNHPFCTAAFFCWASRSVFC